MNARGLPELSRTALAGSGESTARPGRRKALGTAGPGSPGAMAGPRPAGSFQAAVARRLGLPPEDEVLYLGACGANRPVRQDAPPH